MLCGEWSLVNRLDDRTKVVTLKCRSWGCEHCAEMRKQELKRLARSGRPNTFLTLTVRPDLDTTPAERARKLVWAWRTVRRRAMKHYGYSELPFLSVFEVTKRGEPHLHILARCPWIDQAWLSDQMRALIDAPIVDIRRVKSLKKVAGYVAKYIAKQPARFVGCKRYWRSQDYQQDQETDEFSDPHGNGDWEMVKETIESIVETAQKMGFIPHWGRNSCELVKEQPP